MVALVSGSGSTGLWQQAPVSYNGGTGAWKRWHWCVAAVALVRDSGGELWHSCHVPSSAEEGQSNDRSVGVSVVRVT